MDTSSSLAPDPSRTSAIWVTGTGAFLLLAAAATFIAVRWGDIPASAKLGAISLLTGGFLLAGHRLRPTLPATANALFHLGAFLVPVDVAAVGARVGFTWDQMLLAQGVVATATFALAARAQQSVVLRWASSAAVVVLAGGVGGTTEGPAGLALASVAVAAVAAGHDRAGVAWAAVAGLAPVVALAEGLVLRGVGTMERLGLIGDFPRLTGVLTGTLAAVALSVAARRQQDVGLALIAACTGLLGALTTWTGLDATTGSSLVGAASLFLVIELVALATRRDPFWRQVAHPVAVAAECLGGLGALLSLLVVLVAPISVVQGTAGGAAAAVATVAWLVGLVRRDLRWTPAPMAGTVSAATAALLLSGSTTPVALVLVAATVAVAATLPTRPGCLPVVFVASVWAPVQPHLPVPVAIGCAAAAAAAVAVSAVRRPAGADEAAIPLAMWALAPLALGGLVAASEFPLAVSAVAFVLAAHAIAAILDRSAVVLDQLPLGSVPRMLTPAALVAAAHGPAGAMAWVAAAVAVAGLADAVRLRQPLLSIPAALSLPVAVATMCLANGYDLSAAGVAVTATAVVVAGLGSMAGKEWQLVTAGTAAGCAALGVALASGDQVALAHALVAAGGLLGAAGVTARQPAVALTATAVATLGLWVRLDAASVEASEPYLAPVAATLLALGVSARRRGAGSWLAYGPAVALAGGPALAERLAGGGGAHGLVAGAVGVAAVLAGGARRLSAPLLLGTGLLVPVVVYESLAVTAGVPTWAWLAIGGASLLGAGVAMERHDTGPLETGRRIADVLRDRFA